MKDEELDLIDKLLSLPGNPEKFDGRPITCAVVHPEIELHESALLEAGFVSYAYLPDFRSRRQYERSLWLRRADNRAVPELYVLATMKYGKLVPAIGVQPYWTDKDFTNNHISNVSLALPKVVKGAPVSRYGVRSGTPEYYKKYYSDPSNRAKQREASKRHAARRRDIVRSAEDAVASTDGGADALQQLRERILGTEDGRKDHDSVSGAATPLSVKREEE